MQQVTLATKLLTEYETNNYIHCTCVTISKTVYIQKYQKQSFNYIQAIVHAKNTIPTDTRLSIP